MDSLSKWLLEHYGKEQFNPGLLRIEAALRPLKSAFKDTQIVTIAGTNGKGETTLRLDRFLGNCPRCTWTSPHIQRITERFRCEEGEIPLGELEGLVHECHQKVLQESLQLTYYEFLFFVFCTWASRRNPQYLLLEVGLGGRLDAVNAFDADLVLLPSISRDHQEFLGKRYDLILREKLGVMRKKSLLLTYVDLAYLKERARDLVQTLGAKMVDLEEVLPLPREDFSQRNQFLAYAAYLSLQRLPIRSAGWVPEEGGLEHRGEVICKRGDWTFFGSHNVDGLRKLIQFLTTQNYNNGRTSFDAVVVAFSQRPTQDLQVMIKMIKASGLGKVKVTFFPHPKAASGEVMEALARQEGLEFVEDIDSYVQGTNSGKILVTGSYYFLGYLKSLLERRES